MLWITSLVSPILPLYVVVAPLQGPVGEEAVRCPFCGSVDDDRVVDSRESQDGTTIRRRRACAACGRRFTTFERVEEAPLLVLKRDGSKERFDRDKLVSGLDLIPGSLLNHNAVSPSVVPPA